MDPHRTPRDDALNPPASLPAALAGTLMAGTMQQQPQQQGQSSQRPRSPSPASFSRQGGGGQEAESPTYSRRQVSEAVPILLGDCCVPQQTAPHLGRAFCEGVTEPHGHSLHTQCCLVTDRTHLPLSILSSLDHSTQTIDITFGPCFRAPLVTRISACCHLI